MKNNTTNSSRSLSRRPIDRMAVRAALIVNLRLDQDDPRQLDNRAWEYINSAKIIRGKVLKGLANRALYYKLLAMITAATMLLSEDGARQLRAACFRLGVTARGETPLLRLALKAFGPYDYTRPERRRSADKRLSRDFHALEFATRQGVIPTRLIRFFGTPGNGLDECSRGKQNEIPKVRRSIYSSGAVHRVPLRIQWRAFRPCGGSGHCIVRGAASRAQKGGFGLIDEPPPRARTINPKT